MKTIEELAREAGGVEQTYDTFPMSRGFYFDERGLTRFAALVAEQCAQIAESGVLDIRCSADEAVGVVRRTRAAAAAEQRAAFPMPKG